MSDLKDGVGGDVLAVLYALREYMAACWERLLLLDGFGGSPIASTTPVERCRIAKSKILTIVHQSPPTVCGQWARGCWTAHEFLWSPRRWENNVVAWQDVFRSGSADEHIDADPRTQSRTSAQLSEGAQCRRCYGSGTVPVRWQECARWRAKDQCVGGEDGWKERSLATRPADKTRGQEVEVEVLW